MNVQHENIQWWKTDKYSSLTAALRAAVTYHAGIFILPETN